MPEQLLFFAVFLLLGLVNLLARWLRRRMAQSGQPAEEDSLPREELPYEIRELPPRAAPRPPPEARVRDAVSLGLPVSPESPLVPLPVSLEEGAGARPPRSGAPPTTGRRRRTRIGLRDRAELRRAIVLRTILGPPPGLERPGRNVEPPSP